jgi:hypothetical protein
MNSGIPQNRVFALFVTAFVLLSPVTSHAQRGGGGGAGRGGAAGGRGGGKQNAPIDLTGYWVAVISEDWELRMVTPPKGQFTSLPLNAEGRRVGNEWDPARDEAAGEQCKSYGAPSIMRIPGRLHITWENDTTLRIDTDAGTQSRLFHFGPAAPGAAGEPSWQGYSAAQWESAPGGGRGGASPGGDLRVVTNNLRPGYFRRNGAPYGKEAVVTEYFDLNALPNGDKWFTVTTKVEDPQYLSRYYLTTSDFKKLPDATGWNPMPCSAR